MKQSCTDHAQVLEELKLTPEQFVDVCILCGCDYAGTIRGIGSGKVLSPTATLLAASDLAHSMCLVPHH